MARKISAELVDGVRQLVEANYQAEAFFWEEDACAPAMNDVALARAADKSHEISARLRVAERLTGVSTGEVAKVINQIRGKREEEPREKVVHRVCAIVHSRVVKK